LIWWNHVHIFKSGFRPVDKVETVFVAPVFDFAVFAERIGVVAAAFHRQRVVDDKLRLHHRIHFGRIAALLRNRIAQARQIHQRGLPQNIMAHHPRRIPRKIDFLLAFYQLAQPALQRRQIDFVRAVDQVLRQNAAQSRLECPHTPHARRSIPNPYRAAVCGNFGWQPCSVLLWIYFSCGLGFQTTFLEGVA